MFPIAHAGMPLIPFLMYGRLPRGWWVICMGALLPDLIDKPLGHLILPENNGRIFAHTLLFSMLLLIAGLRNRHMLLLGYGTLTHLLLDSMYLDPQALLWPLFGGFRSTDFSYTGWLEALGDPAVIIGELIGAMALAYCLFLSFRRMKGPNTKTIYNKMS